MFLKAHAPTTIFKPIKVIKKINNDLDLFLDQLGWEETKDSTFYPYMGYANPWVIVNSIGAKGRWQLTDIALKDISYKGTVEQFLSSRDIQKECVIKLMKKNKSYLKYYKCNKYIGRVVGGIKITLSGALAACHLGGINSFIRFVSTGYNAMDTNESIRSYLIKFQGYNLEQSI